MTIPRLTDRRSLDGTSEANDSVVSVTDSEAPPQKPGRRLLITVALIVGAWLMAMTASALNLLWLMPIFILVVTASLLRSGRTMLDRLMLALGLLLGLTTAAGFLFTIWPFGFSPTVVSAAALSSLALFHFATARLPALPRPALRDVFPIAGAAAVTTLMAKPYLTSDLAGRLALVIAGEDNARHLSAFDAIARTESYLYLVRTGELPDVPMQMLRYPQGWHLTAGLLDRFLPSSADGPGSAIGLLDHYIVWVVGGFGLFVLAVLWAAQWVAQQWLGAATSILLALTITGFMVIGDTPGLLIWGFPAETHGLALLALLLAVLTKSDFDKREHIVLAGALVVGIGLSYYFLLPVAGLAAGVWLVRHRAAIRSRWLTVVLTAGAVALLAPIATVVGILRDKQLSSALTQGGGVERVDRLSFFVLVSLIVAGLVSQAALRSPMWRSYRWTAIVVMAPAVLIFVYQRMTIGQSSYYFEKALHAVVVTCLVGLGVVVLMLPSLPRVSWSDVVRRLNVVVLSVALVAALGVVVKNSDYRRTITGDNIARKWFGGVKRTQYRALAEKILSIDREFPDHGGVTTVVLADDWATTYLCTLYLSALQRSSGLTNDVVYHPNRKQLDVVDHPEQAEAILAFFPGRVRVIAVTPKSYLFMEAFYQHNSTVEHVELASPIDVQARVAKPYGPSRR